MQRTNGSYHIDFIFKVSQTQPIDYASIRRRRAGGVNALPMLPSSSPVMPGSCTSQGVTTCPTGVPCAKVRCSLNVKPPKVAEMSRYGRQKIVYGEVCEQHRRHLSRGRVRTRHTFVRVARVIAACWSCGEVNNVERSSCSHVFDRTVVGRFGCS